MHNKQIPQLLALLLLMCLVPAMGLADDFSDKWGDVAGYHPPADWTSDWGMPGDWLLGEDAWNEFWHDYNARPRESSPVPMGNLQSARIGNCREYVNLRDGPSTDSPIIGKAYLGTPLELMEWNREGDWCKVLLNNRGSAAWVAGQFIVR